MEGILHTYHPKRSLLLFEHKSLLSPSSPTNPPPRNTLLFIGGMYDNFQAPKYLTSLASLFPPPSNWSLMHVQLSSAGRSFGTSDLNKDISEIAVAVDFIRTTLRPSSSTSTDEAPIVLMGHSTGCQDVLHYLISSSSSGQPHPRPRPKVQGAILQAAVSDRDQLNYTIQTSPKSAGLYHELTTLITSTPVSKHNTTILPLDLTSPLFGPAPLTISRFLSLASPTSPAEPGMDDLFSHDLTDARHVTTFGSVGRKGVLDASSLLVVLGGADEYVPPYVGVGGLLGRWRGAMVGSGCLLDVESGVVGDATHGYEREDWSGRWAREVELRERVLRYLDRVVGGVGQETWKVWDDGKKALEREKKGSDDRKRIVEKSKDVKL